MGAVSATVAGGDVERAHSGRRGADVRGIDFIPAVTGVAKPARAVVAGDLCRNEFPLLRVGDSAGEGVGHLGEQLGRLAVGGPVGHTEADATGADAGRGAAGSQDGFVRTGGAEDLRENAVAGVRRLNEGVQIESKRLAGEKSSGGSVVEGDLVHVGGRGAAAVDHVVHGIDVVLHVEISDTDVRGGAGGTVHILDDIVDAAAAKGVTCLLYTSPS